VYFRTKVIWSIFLLQYISILLDLKERNCVVAQKWSELGEDERKAWSLKAEAVCEASLQRDSDPSSSASGESIPDSAIIEKALITIQEKVGFYY